MEATNNKYGIFWRRYWAYAIDSFIIGILMIILIVSFGLASPGRISIPFIFCIFWFLYRILFHQSTGQTIGKSVTNIIVLDKDEKKLLSTVQCIKREIIPIVIALIVSYYIYERSFQPEYEHLYSIGSTTRYEDTSGSTDSSYLQTDTNFSMGRAFKMIDEYAKEESEKNKPTDAIRYSSLIWDVIVCVSMLSNSRRRGLHDMFAKTVVVRKEVWDRENEEKQLTEGEDNGSHTS